MRAIPRQERINMHIHCLARFCGGVAYWRDLCPWCPVCERTIVLGQKVSGSLLAMTREWGNALQTHTEIGDVLLSKSSLIYNRLSREPMLLKKGAARISLPAGSHVASALTAKIAMALTPPFWVEGPDAADVARGFGFHA